MSDPTYEFDLPFQRKIAALFTRDTVFAQRTVDVIDPDYFTEESVRTLVRIVKSHLDVYDAVPDMRILPTLIKDEIAAKRIRKDGLDELKDLLRECMKADLSNPKFVADKIVGFARHQAMEQAIMESVGYLEKGDFTKIEERMRAALAVGILDEAVGYNYFDEITNRSTKRDDIASGKVLRSGISSGYPLIDSLLYHAGWGRKELSCFMGPAKSGKSMMLGDMAKNASLGGYNVLYVTCEVSTEIIADRLDAAMSNTLMNDLVKSGSIASVDAAIRRLQAGAGRLEIREYASGTLKPSDLRRVIEKYRTDGMIFDMVVVDYADIMAPNHRADDLRENLRTIYIDLRAIAFDFNVALLTATQTNREGAKAATAKATDVGDDWNKARTVDVLIGINATDDEKKAGKARLYWALSRSTIDGVTVEIEQDRARMIFVKKILGVK